MISIGQKFCIDSAHRLMKDEGICKNIHGHSYKIEIEISGKFNTDMILHFSEMKKIIKSVLDRYDHAIFLNSNDKELLEDKLRGSKIIIFKNSEPTVENLTVNLFCNISEVLKNGLFITSIKVWEGKDKYCILRNDKQC